jgi:hypothetical protein
MIWKHQKKINLKQIKKFKIFSKAFPKHNIKKNIIWLVIRGLLDNFLPTK